MKRPVSTALALGVAVAFGIVACAKTDDPKAPAAAVTATSVANVTGEPDCGLDAVDAVDAVDAQGALRALPMPQQFPRYVWDAARVDARQP